MTNGSGVQFIDTQIDLIDTVDFHVYRVELCTLRT